MKPESFKTVTTKAINRVKKAGAEGGDGAAATANGTEGKGKGESLGVSPLFRSTSCIVWMIALLVAHLSSINVIVEYSCLYL